jgi:GAF domain-containing protein/HAMP domain-containing protein
MSFSLRFKIIFITVAILVFAIGATTLVSGYVFSQEYSDVLQSRALIIGQGVKSQLDRLLELGIPLEELVGFEKQMQDTVDTYEDIAYAMIVDLEGKILFHNDPSQHNKMLTDPATLRAINSGEEIIQVYSDQEGQFYDVFIPILDRSGDHVGAIRLGFPVELVTQKTGRLTTFSGLVAFVSLGVAVALLVFTLSVWVSRPLMRLLTAIEEFRKGETGWARKVKVDSRDEIGQLGSAFNTMSVQLQNLIDTLEEQVANRTRQLEAVMQITQQLASILDLSDLLRQIVILTKETFDYYHVQIYLLDESSQMLQLVEGYGQAGMEMKARGYKIVLDSSTSMVARSARTGEIVQVDNVREEADWLPNPLLPDTYSEMAVPINLAGQVVGVLDVQDDEVASLDKGDADLLYSLANQVAVAIHNARLFTAVETALAEARATQARYAQQSWEKTKIAPAGGQYLYVDPNTTPPGKHEQEAMTEVERKALAQNHAVVVVSNESIEGESLVVPINLHNKTIGALQLHTAGNGLIWDKDDLTLVQTVADQIAQAAENLRLFDETRQRAGREQTIRQITEHMRSATNLDELVKITAEELGQRFSAKYAFVKLGLDTSVEDSGRQTNGHKEDNY